MRAHRMDAFIIPTADPHASEYTPAHWECRQWLTGFTGSAGTAVVTMEEAALWTDSRYFLQAGRQLADTPWQLMREGMEGTPGMGQWLTQRLDEGAVVGADGAAFGIGMLDSLQAATAQKKLRWDIQCDPFEEIWPLRPPLPAGKAWVHPLAYAGESARDKLTRLHRCLAQLGCEAMLVTALDEAAWLLNLRGADIHCNPVALCYCLVLPHEVVLYMDAHKLPQGPLWEALLQETGLKPLPYADIWSDLPRRLGRCRCLLTPQANARLRQCLQGNDIALLPSPLNPMKAVKNEVEIEGFRRAMLRDGVAMVKFLRWLLPAVQAGGQTEMSVSRRLEQLRAEDSQYRGASFDTIAAYAAHGAIVHYEPTPQTDIPLEPRGLLLLDSGGQYPDGTTDITRTIALGPLTEEEKLAYTLVLKGHIGLSRLHFPDGASGTQLDLAARAAMWREGYNYGHGTGHGVGSFLCVHEGPHQIRQNYVGAPLRKGMTVTDEPGIYLEDCFGVRTENMLLCVPAQTTAFGHFLKFEPLTLCPIDLAPVLPQMLTSEETEWLDAYHARVRASLMPLLAHEADRQWLIQATQPLKTN